MCYDCQGLSRHVRCVMICIFASSRATSLFSLMLSIAFCMLGLLMFMEKTVCSDFFRHSLFGVCNEVEKSTTDTIEQLHISKKLTASYYACERQQLHMRPCQR